MKNFENLIKEKELLVNKKKIFYNNLNRLNLNLDDFNKFHAKKFSAKESITFAKISGDHNPIHVDKYYAQDTFFGKPLIHGIHALIYALNILTKKEIFFEKIKIIFLKPIFENKKLFFYFNESNNLIFIVHNNVICTKIFIETKYSEFSNDLNIKYIRNKRKKKSKIVNLKKISVNEKYKFNHVCDLKKAKIKYPYIFKFYGDLIASEIIDLSYLIGMECPGYYSMFSEAQISIKKNSKDQRYFVKNIDKRFNLINLNVLGNSINADLKAFFRPKKVQYPKINKLLRIIKKNEFASIKALIIGGSKGLGKLTAKIIAAGGGEVIITYNESKNEAKKTYDEIKNFGSKCKIIKFDVKNQINLKNIKTEINQCYYYATPKIFQKEQKEYDNKMLTKFLQYYVKNFQNIFKYINKSYPKCRYFIPSTISINKPIQEILEYTLAKLETEIWVSRLSEKFKNKILIERLPRLLTEQTNTILQNKLTNTNITILNSIRKLTNNE
tara:strand:+ start:1014 stop:2507 length:1494 start_codon:yes stop_codon:yes gene_type:complete